MRLETPADLARLPWVLQQGSDEFDVWLAAHDVRVAGKHDIIHLPGYMILPAARDGQAGQVYRGGTVMKNQSTSAALSGDQASKRDYGHHRGERPDGGQRPTLFAMPGCGLPKT